MSSAACDRLLARAGLNPTRGDRELLTIALADELARERREAAERTTNHVAAALARLAQLRDAGPAGQVERRLLLHLETRLREGAL